MATVYYGDVYDPFSATLLTINNNSITPHIDGQLGYRGAISGRVTDKSGNPLPDVAVRAAYNNPFVYGDWWIDIQNPVVTDATGYYTFCCLNPIPHRLFFGSENSQTYLAEFYQNAYAAVDATPILVTPAATAPNIDAQLERYGRIEGRVTNRQQSELDDITVTLYQYIASQDEWEIVQSAPTFFTGSYAFVGLLPGEYRLGFTHESSQKRYRDQFYQNATSLEAATSIPITYGVVKTADVVLDSITSISGTIVDQFGEPLAGIWVSVFDSHNPNIPRYPIASTQTHSRGSYSVEGLVGGSYLVAFSNVGLSDALAKPDLHNVEFYDDITEFSSGAEIISSATVIQAPIGTKVEDINAQLVTKPTIAGRVTDEAGEPLENIYVQFERLIAEDTGSGTWQRWPDTYTKTDGTYQSGGLQPGIYRVTFQDTTALYKREYFNNVHYVEQATEISVTQDAKINGIDAELLPRSFNLLPEAEDDTFELFDDGTTPQLSSGPYNILHNDRDADSILTAAVVTPTVHGQLSLYIDGTFTYVRNHDTVVNDSFTYLATDGENISNIATVRLTIVPVNNALWAKDDTIAVPQGGNTTTLASGFKSLLANDVTINSTSLTTTVVTEPQHGLVVLNTDGTFTYTHDGGNTLTDGFQYRAVDNWGTSDVGAVSILITPTLPSITAFTFDKTVSIEGMEPRCSSNNQVQVPVETTVVYCYTIHNTGEVTLATHSLVDSHLGQLLQDVNYVLAPGTTYSTTFTQTLMVSTTNVATWTVTADTGEVRLLIPDTATAQNVATVTISDPTVDQDADGIPDNLERAGDPDSDNIPNFLDTDADGDGTTDRVEAGDNPTNPPDSNNDGIPDYLDKDIQRTPGHRLYLPVIRQ